MNEEIIAAIEIEEAKLVQRLEAVRQMLAVYRGERRDVPQKAAKPAATPKAARTLDDRMDKFGPYGHRIVDSVADLLPANGGNPVTTRALVEQLDALNIEITGENKVNSLSALLARSSKMKGYGRAGWTLHSDTPGKLYPLNLDKDKPNDDERESSDLARVVPLVAITKTAYDL